MSTKELRVQPDARDPLRNEPSELPGGHRSIDGSTREEKSRSSPLCSPEIFVDGLSGLIRQLEFDRSASFLLPNHRAVDSISVWRNVLDLEADHIAASELAVYGQIEHSEVAGSPSD
jgi:hypothetical protein